MRQPQVFFPPQGRCYRKIPVILGLLAVLAFVSTPVGDAQEMCGPMCKVHSNPNLHPLNTSLTPNAGLAGSRAGSWEQLGPEGGTFYGVVTDPADADVATLIGPTIQRTKDGGASWTQLGVTSFSVMAFASFDFNRLYASGFDPTTYQYSIYVSNDGGVNWDAGALPPNSGYPFYVAGHPTDQNTIFACGYQYMGAYLPMFYKSVDGGKNFTATDITSQVGNMICYSVTVCPTNPSVLYMSGYNYTGSFVPKVIKSTDGGATWAELTSVPYNAQEVYIVEMAVDPANANIVYASGAYTYVSMDAGATWTESTFNSYCYDLLVNGSGVVYNACPDGVMMSKDQGATWITCPVGGIVNYLHSAPALPSTMFASAYYTGVAKSIDGGVNWDLCCNGILNSTIYGLTTSPSEPETVYCSPYGLAALIVSTESGLNWQGATLPPEGTYTNSLLVNSSNKDVMLAVLPGG